MQSKYLDLSNKPYLRKLPDLNNLDPNTETLRLTALYLHNISEITYLENLKKLNISFTYVKIIPYLPLLEELCMIEVDLNNYDDLVKFTNLKRLKMTHDDINLTVPLPSVELLHCAVVHRPDLLYNRFPNLKELRFEHIHPKEKGLIANLDYFDNIVFRRVKTTRTVIQNKVPVIVDEFDDEFDDEFNNFNFMDYIGYFVCGRLEYIYVCKQLAKLRKHNINTIRYGDRMNVYNLDGSLFKSFERNKVLLSKNKVIETISDEEYVKMIEYKDDYTIYYPKKDDQYNKPNNKKIAAQYKIIKEIIQNNYQLNDSIKEDINNFTGGDDLFDKVIRDIKYYGLTAELIEKIKWVDRRHPEAVKSDNSESDEDSDSQEIEVKTNEDNILTNAEIKKIYPKTTGVLQDLSVQDIKDILWYQGKQYILSDTQKQAFVDKIKKINDKDAKQTEEFKQCAKDWPYDYARVTEHGIAHYKRCEDGTEYQVNLEGHRVRFDDNGNEVIIDENGNDIPKVLSFLEVVDVVKNWFENLIPNKTEICDQDDTTSSEEAPGNLCYKVQVPGDDAREEYDADKGYPNNIFLENTPIIMTDDDLSVVEQSGMCGIWTEKYYLEFYGKAGGLTTNLMKNMNGYIVLGLTADEGKYENLDALLDKKFQDKNLSLPDVFFMFKNRLYTSFLASKKGLHDYTEDVVIVDGQAGFGGTWYGFDCIFKPHPNLITNVDMTIQSPLCKSLNHNKIHKCCNNDANF